MKTYTIPFDFSMDNCPWFEVDGTVLHLTAEVELSEEEAREIKNNSPLFYQKLDNAVNEVCKKVSYQYALINEFTENQVFYDEEEKMMSAFEKESLFDYDPDKPGTDPDKKTEFSIWLEEYFFSLDHEKMVEFIEKYYGYTANRLTEEKLKYKYSFTDAF